MAKVKEIEAFVGMSVELKEGWYKFGLTKRVTLEEGDDEKEETKKLWDDCYKEVENQIEMELSDK